MVWHDLKTYVSSKLCKSENETICAIEDFRRSLTPEKCKRYIVKLKELMIDSYLIDLKIT